MHADCIAHHSGMPTPHPPSAARAAGWTGCASASSPPQPAWRREFSTHPCARSSKLAGLRFLELCRPPHPSTCPPHLLTNGGPLAGGRPPCVLAHDPPQRCLGGRRALGAAPVSAGQLGCGQAQAGLVEGAGARVAQQQRRVVHMNDLRQQKGPSRGSLCGWVVQLGGTVACAWARHSGSRRGGTRHHGMHPPCRPAPPQLPHMGHALTRWHLGHLKLLRSGLGFSAGRRCASRAPSSCKAQGKHTELSGMLGLGMHPTSGVKLQLVPNRHTAHSILQAMHSRL